MSASLREQIAIGYRELQRAKDRTLWLYQGPKQAFEESSFTAIAIQNRIHDLERQLAACEHQDIEPVVAFADDTLIPRCVECRVEEPSHG